MHSERRRRVSGLPRLAALAVAVVAAIGCSPAVDDTSPIGQALARTEQRLATQEVHGDVAFLLTQAAQHRGANLRLRLLPDVMANRYTFPFSVEYALWTMRDADLPQLAFTLPPAGSNGFDRAEASRHRVAADALRIAEWQGGQVMDLMNNVLTCKAKTVSALVGAPGYQYLSTHQVVGLLLAVQRDCLEQDVVAAEFGGYVGRVRDEFQLDLPAPALTDLQVERAAVLCMVGQCAEVPDRFRQRLLREQGADGIWVLKNDPLVARGMLPPEHATALAYYALAASASAAAK